MKIYTSQRESEQKYPPRWGTLFQPSFYICYGSDAKSERENSAAEAIFHPSKWDSSWDKSGAKY